MAFSNSTDFSYTRDQLIYAALRKCRAYDTDGGAPQAYQVSDAAEALNCIIKRLNLQGTLLWGLKYLSIPCVADRRTYIIANQDNDDIALSQSRVGAGNLTLNGAATTNGTFSDEYARRVRIASTGNDSGITFTVTGTDIDDAALVEVITGANATAATSTGFFKTISSIATSGATASTVIVGAVCDYDGAAPIKVLGAMLRDESTAVETPLTIQGRLEYGSTSDKFTTSQPSNVYYNEKTGLGVLYVWPVPEDATQTIVLDVETQLDDLDASGNGIRVPSYAYDYLKWELSAELATDYGLAVEERIYFEKKAERLLIDLMSFQRGAASIRFGARRL
jgi:hypothetical protein